MAIKEFGRLDVLVNNAGIMDDMSPVAEMSDEMLEELMRVNTYGPLYAMREAVKVFLAQGEGGNIINIASVGSEHNTAGVAYAASKAALVAVTKNTAFMYMGDEIRCNAISPGGVLTEIALSMPPSKESGMGRVSDLLSFAPEMGMPEDIAAVALFLASDESHFVNGTVITADGGWTNC
jgi:NAD(P)-dependent dehydrogenase (short-subunit alcohol dehydrogenase family)